MGNGTERIDAVLPESYYLDKAGVRTLWEKCKGSGVGGGGPQIIMDSNIYSHEERVVGKYINEEGKYKPIYRRAYNLTSPNRQTVWTQVIPESEIHIDFLISINGQLETGQLQGINININCNGGEWYISSEQGALKMLVRNLPILNKPFTVILEWTKTTDEWTDYTGESIGPIIGFGGSGEINISFEERKVGVYTNAEGKHKPIYQRTFSFTSPSTVNTKLVVVSSDILHAEELIGLSGWVLSANGFSYLFGAEGSYYLLALSSEALVAQISNVGYANQPATATIQWIKTTDSWSDTKPIIDGGSSEEIYTTEERRIGTWIDGKPLYRLSIETTVENPGTASAIMELPAEAEVKMFQGFAKRVDNGAIYSLPNTEPNDVGHNISCYYEYSKIMVWAGSGVATRLKNGKFWAIAEYTKTTDS